MDQQFIQSQLLAMQQNLAETANMLGIEQKVQQLQQIDEQLSDDDIWKNQQRLQQLSQQRASLEKIVITYQGLNAELQNLQEFYQLAQLENDVEALQHCATEMPILLHRVEKLQTQTLFAHALDNLNCYVEVQSGSGGTEAQDWAQMLLRQYLRWAERHDFKATVLDISDGEVAGIKSASVHITGDNAYGWLRTETGIHRLVRKSPFDSGSRRHTSFASIFVSPEIDDSFEVEINPADVRVDVYRASGAGGQHVNKTESAVRLTHTPTGLVTQCQNSRSQHANKAEAMKQLRAKLYDREMHNRHEQKQQLEESKSDIGWGNQIRSYVLDSGRIKDLRTGVEMSNTQSVLDGDLDRFIIASLRAEAKQAHAKGIST